MSELERWINAQKQLIFELSLGLNHLYDSDENAALPLTIEKEKRLLNLGEAIQLTLVRY